jgi:hypothetical protein
MSKEPARPLTNFEVLCCKKIDQLLLPQYLLPGQIYEEELDNLSFLIEDIDGGKEDILYLITLLKEDGLPITTRGRIINEIRENIWKTGPLSQVGFLSRNLL